MPTDQENLNQTEGGAETADRENDGARGKKKKPLLIILIIAGVAILAVAGLVIALLMKRGRTEKPPEAPAYYFSEDEEVSSVTTVLGERRFEIMEIEPVAEQTTAPSSESADQTDTAAPTETDTSASTAAETETENEFTPKKYRYYPEEEVKGDLDTYIEYLKSEKGFIDVTSETETGETPESETEAETEQDAVSAILLTGPSVHPENYLTILLETASDSYTVTAAAVNEPWNTYFTGLWEEQKKELKQAQNKKPEQKTTKEKAEETISSFGMEKLGLSGSISDYEFIANTGLITVNENNYYSVTAYRQEENGTVTFAASYLLDYETGKKIYLFDIMTNEITPLN